ncbi:hypothetical protein [Roseomonas sp. BN140053]|uniref:hypothetical protein n=1 Tax=Roseomonas sp. BN140053 TaxID=3391898 RepID=UPI0039EB2F05
MARTIVSSNTAGVTQGLATLADALFPNPEKEAAALANASTARLNRARTADVELGTTGRTQMSQALRQNGSIADILAGAALAGAPSLAASPEAIRASVANRPGATPAEIDNAMLGAGQGYGQTQGGFRLDQDNTIRRANIAAGPGYAAVGESRRYHDASLGQADQHFRATLGENQRQWNGSLVETLGGTDGSTPVYTDRGSVVPGQTRVVPSQDQVRAGALAPLLAPNAPAMTPNQEAILAPAAHTAGSQPVNIVRGGQLATAPRREVGLGDILAPTDPTDIPVVAAAAGQAPNPAVTAALDDAARRAAAFRRTANPPQALDVSPAEAKLIRDSVQSRILARLNEGTLFYDEAGRIAPDLLDQLVSKATVRYQQTRNAAQAVDEIVEGELGGNEPNITGRWNPVVGNVYTGSGPASSTPRPPSGGAPAPVPAPAARPQAAAAAPGAPPAAAFAGLGEGVPRQFANGQVWTIQAGQPVRVR